jgi:hypothetical protein
MGRPLRNLHQIHSKSPLELDICNIRTITGFPQSFLPQAHGSIGLCVKKTGAGKGRLHKNKPWRRRHLDTASAGRDE